MILKGVTVYHPLHQELTDSQWWNTPEPGFSHQFGSEQILEMIILRDKTRDPRFLAYKRKCTFDSYTFCKSFRSSV